LTTLLLVIMGAPAPLTFSVTAMDCGLLPAPEGVMVMAPLYVPDPSPAGETETMSVAGVDPLVGVTESQFPPDDVVAAAVKLNAALELVMLRF
jgi:hypothetical protein